MSFTEYKNIQQQTWYFFTYVSKQNFKLKTKEMLLMQG